MGQNCFQSKPNCLAAGGDVTKEMKFRPHVVAVWSIDMMSFRCHMAVLFWCGDVTDNLWGMGPCAPDDWLAVSIVGDVEPWSLILNLTQLMRWSCEDMDDCALQDCVDVEDKQTHQKWWLSIHWWVYCCLCDGKVDRLLCYDVDVASNTSSQHWHRCLPQWWRCLQSFAIRCTLLCSRQCRRSLRCPMPARKMFANTPAVGDWRCLRMKVDELPDADVWVYWIQMLALVEMDVMYPDGLGVSWIQMCFTTVSWMRCCFIACSWVGGNNDADSDVGTNVRWAMCGCCCASTSDGAPMSAAADDALAMMLCPIFPMPAQMCDGTL